MTGRPVVLVIDDSAEVRSVIGAVLERKGFDMVEAQDPPSAVEALKNGTSRSRRARSRASDNASARSRRGTRRLARSEDQTMQQSLRRLPVLILLHSRSNEREKENGEA